MKPLNINKSSCTEISSNCVIWNGPDISCIGLCKGDTVTEVVYELSTKLCEIIGKLDVDNYDLECLNITTCPPETFEDLLQTLIEKICEIQATPCPPCSDGNNGNYVVAAVEPAGLNCEFGGTSITTYSGVTNLPIPGSAVYACNGADGSDGAQGDPGGPGIPGTRGEDGNPKTFQIEGSCSIVVEEVSTSPDYQFSINMYDTGWHDLLGFAHMSGAAIGVRPQVRQYGERLYFRGTIVIPLSNGSGGVLPWVNSLSNGGSPNNALTAPFTGTGGVTLNTPNGNVLFNNGNSVLPPAIETFPQVAYTTGTLAFRRIGINSATSTLLSGYIGLGISLTGVMNITALSDIEETSSPIGAIFSPAEEYHPSSLRYITSNVTAGERVPNHFNSNKDSHPIAANTVAITTDFNNPASIYPLTCNAGNIAQLGNFYTSVNDMSMFVECS